MRKARHVIASAGGGWSVRQSGASRSTRTFGNQADAVRYARAAAKKERTDIFIHRADGSIRQVDSYGNDAYPPKSGR
ncbi:DUF2188 domain-containing protein [Xanthobacteraceae bacterium Astr-EGSB]|uniref:DUF2188 domain-containing protein n=1 Tax=Astrobacterium formosum TaxID=3069710 RepID=UPI0027B6CE90|nr:DUF2188 domain-containing protein [Xanthobacteraceae bacterium Astr-EGSB]